MTIFGYKRQPAKYAPKRQDLCGIRALRLGVIIFFLAISFFMPGNRTSAAEPPLQVSLPADVHQGEPFFFRLTSPEPIDGAQIEWLGDKLWAPAHREADQWIILALFGVGLDKEAGLFPFRATISVSGTQVAKKQYISVVSKTFPSQRLTLPPRMVTPDAAALERIRREATKIRELLLRVSPVQHWWPDFTRPVPGDVSSPFGVRRIINKEPRAPHRGVDFRGKQGTPVSAWSAGRVVLVGDHYFGGLSIYLDHGLGVISSYLHLSKILIAEGDFVLPGQIIGLVGATGRSTAPHLHFGLSVLGQWVDPMLLWGIKKNGPVKSPDAVWR